MTGNLLVFLGAALASAVEMVETLTIVLALGVTRGWRAPLQGAVAALAVLVVLVALLGPALQTVPINLLRLVVGSLLLVFGLQWLRKAILRASGLKAAHDEEEAFAAEVTAARAAGRPAQGVDRYALAISFKSTLLEGFEVAFIVITLGATQGAIGIAAAGAVVAFVVVVIVGVLVRHPLSRVPENTLKFVVGVMLTSFGTFWVGEGVGIDWPGAEASLAALIVLTAAWSLLFTRLLEPRSQVAPT
ncbi:MAG: hypothetical protein WCJ67_01625 [Thermoleophilia bacterium]